MATEESRAYNRERLARQANAKEINVGDPRTAVYDRLMGSPMDGNQTKGGGAYRSKVRVADSEAVWDVTTRPRRNPYKKK